MPVVNELTTKIWVRSVRVGHVGPPAGHRVDEALVAEHLDRLTDGGKGEPELLLKRLLTRSCGVL